MKQLADLVGQTVVGRVPILDQKIWQRLKIHGIESSGLWIENQKVTDQTLEQSGVTSAPKTLVFFLPFHQIDFLIDSVDIPALSEKAFFG